MPLRILSLLLCLLVAGPMSLPAHAVARPETRVEGFFPSPLKSASADLDQTAGLRWENRGCGYDFASGVCKYLYAHGNPVNRIDPSGNTDFIQMLATTKIGATIIALGGPAIAAANRSLPAIVRGTAQAAQFAQRIIAAGGDIVAWEQRVRFAGQFVGRFRLDMVVRLPGKTINTLIESKGVPWNLYSSNPNAWQNFLTRLQNQANAFSQATHAANGQPIGERVIAFTSRIPQGLEAAGEQLKVAIGNNYQTVLWGEQMFDDFVGGK